jgi:DNA-binding PadR family transcriptional regulator
MQPTAVTWVVLGLVALKPRSGYEIKRIVDRSIRHFWAASYGQIYPELRRLEEEGWIAGEDDPRGGRSRRVYGITPAGRAGLRGWLAGRETRIEMRDESL